MNPDLFTAMVQQVEERWRCASTNGTVHLVKARTVLALLRRQHAAVERMVKQVREEMKGQSHPVSRLDTCEAILTAIRRLRKETP